MKTITITIPDNDLTADQFADFGNALSLLAHAMLPEELWEIDVVDNTVPDEVMTERLNASAKRYADQRLWSTVTGGETA